MNGGEDNVVRGCYMGGGMGKLPGVLAHSANNNTTAFLIRTAYASAAASRSLPLVWKTMSDVKD